MNPNYLKIRKQIYRKGKPKKPPVLRSIAIILLCGALILLPYGIKAAVIAGSTLVDAAVSTEESSTVFSEKENYSVPMKTCSEESKNPIKVGDSSLDSQNSNPIFSEAEKAEDFFQDALFIGDSRTEGLSIYSNLPDTTFYAKKGLTVENIFSDAFIQEGEEKLTVLQALSRNTFSEIYVMLGINELGWQYENIFIEKYEKLIKEIKEHQPLASIFIQSILPVTKEKSESDAYINQTRINQYNNLLQELAEKEKIKYIPVGQALCTEDGFLPEEASVDGVHLNRKYCEKWVVALQELVSKEEKKSGITS